MVLPVYGPRDENGGGGQCPLRSLSNPETLDRSWSGSEPIASTRPFQF